MHEMVEIVADSLAARRVDQQRRHFGLFRSRQIEILHEGRALADQLECVEVRRKGRLQRGKIGRLVPTLAPFILVDRRVGRLQ